MSKEGSTQAPIRHPINFNHPDFLDPKKLDDEIRIQINKIVRIQQTIINDRKLEDAILNSKVSK